MRSRSPAARPVPSTPAAINEPALDALIDGVEPLSPATRETVEFIARHYDQPLRLAHLTALTDQTPFQLIRTFRREIGTTPHAFLLRVRIAVGTTLLAAGEPIAGIASAVGFVDQAHFTRHFKRVHGRTPARYAAQGRSLRRGGAAGDRYAAAAC